MDDLALNHSGSLGENFLKFEEKNKNVIHQPRSVRIGKTVPSVLSTVFANNDFPAGE